MQWRVWISKSWKELDTKKQNIGYVSTNSEKDKTEKRQIRSKLKRLGVDGGDWLQMVVKGLCTMIKYSKYCGSYSIYLSKLMDFKEDKFYYI